MEENDSEDFATLQEAAGASEPHSGDGTQGALHDNDFMIGQASSQSKLNIVNDVDSYSSQSQSLDQKEDQSKKSSNFGMAEIIDDEDDSDSGSEVSKEHDLHHHSPHSVNNDGSSS